MIRKSVLQNLGLTENETAVYLVILRTGSATISDITQKSKVHRVNVYDIIRRLQEKGLISYIIKGKRKFYQALDPKKLVEIEQEKLQQLKEMLPELEELKKMGKDKEEATIFKDRRAIKNIMEDITKSETDVYLFASGWGFEEKFPEYYDIWHKKLAKNKIKIKCLVSKKFKGKKLPKPLVYRYLPDEFVSPSATLVYEDKVFILSWGVIPLGILIKSKEISKSYKKYFELLWRRS
jgi:sugar-specific transcriptional regulator TrmB